MKGHEKIKLVILIHLTHFFTVFSLEPSINQHGIKDEVKKLDPSIHDINSNGVNTTLTLFENAAFSTEFEILNGTDKLRSLAYDMKQELNGLNFMELEGDSYQRNLACSPVHDGSIFQNMFHEGDQWIYDNGVDGSQYYTSSWNGCNLIFGYPSGSNNVKYFFNYMDEKGAVHSYQYDYYSQANNPFRILENTRPYLAANVCKIIVENGVIASNEYRIRLENDISVQYAQTLLASAQSAYDQSSVLMTVDMSNIQNLLNGQYAIVSGPFFSPTNPDIVKARIATKNQVRVFNGESYHYLDRKVVHKDSPGYILSSFFSTMHHEVGGGNNPAFSLCENKSPSRVIPSNSETAFCCDTQCTHDVSNHVWVSSTCEVTISNCYNSLLSDCVTETKICEQLIADPDDQVLDYRIPLPQDNIWIFYGKEDMIGGAINSHGQRFTTKERSIIDGHHSIQYEGPGHGNGKYRITYSLNVNIQKIKDTHDYDKNILDLVVYSHSTQEILGNFLVPTWRLADTIQFDVTIADRHLNDIAFRMQCFTSNWVKLDFVRVQYLFHDTLSPTSTPSSSPTPEPTASPTMFTGIWNLALTGGSYYGSVDVGADAFNDMFRHSETHIIKRLCYNCLSSHQEIYYKRVTKVTTFEPYDYMCCNWYSSNNILNVDFEMYSSYQDAVNGVRKWSFCNYDDTGVGFPRDCGSTGSVGHQWNSKRYSGVGNYAFFINQVSNSFWLGERNNMASPQHADTIQSCTMVNTKASQAIPSTGTISKFQWYGLRSSPVRFQVFRMTSHNNFQLIGTVYSSSTAVGQVNEIDVDPPISVEGGDLLGLTFYGPTAIGYDTSAGYDLGDYLYNSIGAGGPSNVGEILYTNIGPTYRSYYFSAFFNPDP